MAADPIGVRLIAINDFHGHLEPGELAIPVPDPADASRTVALRAGGAAFLAARIAQLRREQPNHVVVSAGDLVGAAPLVSALFRDEPTIEVMNRIGLDLNAVGNHELDHGVAELKRLVRGGCAALPRGATVSCARPDGRYAGARFPFIAANVADDAGKPLFASSLVKTVAGVRIGFIGAVTRSTPGIVMPEGIRGWRFVAEAEAINREARVLEAQGVRAIVAVVHEGGEADGGINACDDPRGEIFDIASRLDRAVDVVLSAHTHRAYVCRIDGRLIVQAASFGRLVAVVDLAIDPASGEVLRDASVARNVPVPNDRNESAAVRAAYPPLVPDDGVARVVAYYRERAAPLADRPAGRIAAPFDRKPSDGGDSAAGRLVADAHLAATRANGAQIALTNPGGLRSDLVAGRTDGTVTFSELFTMQPFGNTLVTLTLSGEQLRLLLESQWSRTDPLRVRLLQPSRGFAYAWRADAPQGARVATGSMTLNGEPIRAQQSYRVTVNSFLASGGDGFGQLRAGTDRTGGPLDVDALATYLRAASRDAPLAPDAAPRIRRID